MIVTPRSTLLAACLVLGILSSLALSLHRQPKNEWPRGERIVGDAVRHVTKNPGAREASGPYQFDQRANDLLRIIFPGAVFPAGYANAYVDRARAMTFASRDDALLYHAESINGDAAVTEPYWRAHEATESFWQSAHPSNHRAEELFEQAGNIETLVRSLVREKGTPTSLFEKALWQRDLICSLQAVLHCEDFQSGSGFRRRASAVRAQKWGSVKSALVESLTHALFTAAEFDQFRGQLPPARSQKHFPSQCRYSLTEDYLPPVVWQSGTMGQASEGSEELAFCHELPSDEEPGLHFQAYGGRSFIRIFIMTPGMNEDQFFKYWANVTDQFGMHVTVSAGVPGLPAGTQTVLLRTFGIFLEDGSYADSGVPEEVLVRVLKYTEATLDPLTSDGLGTLHYQYKLRRDRFLTDPTTLGLERIRDEDGQFYGFFAEVPEPSSTEHLTTMRANCISCHSELLYGASTVFSLCRRSPAKPGPRVREGNQLEKKGPRGWLIKEGPLHTIQKELTTRLEG
jgi:hypothetical protein